jgi:RNA polymerase-binding transcription factor DksA
MDDCPTASPIDVATFPGAALYTMRTPFVRMDSQSLSVSRPGRNGASGQWEEWVVEDVTRLQSAGSRGGYRPLRLSSGRRVASRPRVGLIGERSATLGLALRRLEREHVALLLAIAELESPDAQADAAARAINHALRDLLRDDLRRTQHALSLATQGSYGACESCGRSLARRQLEIAPTTTRCPNCESRAHLQ